MHASCTLFFEKHSSFEEKKFVGTFESSNDCIVFEVFYRSTAHRLQQRKPALLASGGSFSYQVVELRRS